MDFYECASVKHEDQVFFGDIQNISLQGLFIRTDQEIPLNAKVEVTVYHAPNSSIYLQAYVVRREKAGIGMQINRMDVNAFVHLRDTVAMHCNDHDLILLETYKMAGCIH